MASTQTAKSAVVLSSLGGLMKNNLLRSHSSRIFLPLVMHKLLATIQEKN
jgi:hypothetical protein